MEGGDIILTKAVAGPPRMPSATVTGARASLRHAA